jgi:Lipase (class 3)
MRPSVAFAALLLLSLSLPSLALPRPSEGLGTSSVPFGRLYDPEMLDGVLSPASRRVDASIDLGLAARRDAEAARSRASDPTLASVFSAASAPGSRALRTGLTPEQRLAEFDPHRAAALAQLNSIAYCASLSDVAAWNCSRCHVVPGFQPEIVHFDAAWDLLGYLGYWPAARAKVLVFRGTDSSSWYNWAENMRAWRTDASYDAPGAPAGLRVHSGFLIMWNSSSLASTFRAAYAALAARVPDGPTYVVGHSMGGALAQLAALDLGVAHGLNDVRVYTFGSPRVGNAAFADFLRSRTTESWRFTHGRDIVPSVPPLLMGFHHVSREVWLVDVDVSTGTGSSSDSSSHSSRRVSQRLVVCDDSGEDPSCHNSACRLGLCTSVADHLTYMGGHMYRGGEC